MSRTSENYLNDIVYNSFLQAKDLPDEGGSDKLKNRNRSRNWVNCLARNFRSRFSSGDVRVFSKHDDLNRKEFGLNELLYDIVVCRIGYTWAATHNKEVPYVKEAIWQVESEFKASMPAILIDFSKLILGSAPYKLFVGSACRNSEKILDSLIPVGNNCSGQVFISLIPHPKDWDKATGSEVKIYSFKTSKSNGSRASWNLRS